MLLKAIFPRECIRLLMKLNEVRTDLSCINWLPAVLRLMY